MGKWSGVLLLLLVFSYIKNIRETDICGTKPARYSQLPPSTGECFTVWYCRRVYTHLSLTVFMTDRMPRYSHSQTAISKTHTCVIINITKTTFCTFFLRALRLHSSQVLNALEKQNRSTSQHTL